MHLGLTKSRDDKLLQDLLDKRLRVIVVFEDDYLNHIARIAYKDIQQDNYTYRIGEYNIYKGEEWGFCDFCKRHDCYFIVPNETIEGGSSEIPKDLEEAADEYEKKHTYQRYDGGGLTPEYNATLAEAVIFGAKWQKEQDDKDLSEKIAAAYQLGLADKEKQMMKEAVEYDVWDFSMEACPHVNIPLDNKQYRNGDKVRIIVIPNTDKK